MPFNTSSNQPSPSIGRRANNQQDQERSDARNNAGKCGSDRQHIQTGRSTSDFYNDTGQTANLSGPVDRDSAPDLSNVDGVLANVFLGMNQHDQLQVDEIETTDSVDWMTLTLRSALFSRIPATKIQRIFARLVPLSVKAGDEIIRQDAIGDHYYIVSEGRCMVSRKVPNTTKVVQLAELRPGDRFGEEALILDNTRNATVTMLTDGSLMRLDKDDFNTLIKSEIVVSVDYKEAQQRIRDGAMWLDVRFADEYQASGIETSLNLSIIDIRTKANTLAPDTQYIVYCDTGLRSSVAAFLLAERGIHATHLAGGLNATDRVPAGTSDTGTADGETWELRSELERTNLKLQEALQAKSQSEQSQKSAEQETLAQHEHLKKEAQRADQALTETLQLKREIKAAQQAAEEKLRLERERLQIEAKRASHALSETLRLKKQIKEAQMAAELKLRAERQELAKEADDASKVMNAAQSMKAQVEEEKRAVAAEAEKHRMEHRRIQQLNEETKSRLSVAEKRFAEFFRRKKEELSRTQNLANQTAIRLEAQGKVLASESIEAKGRLADAKCIEQEMEKSRLMASEQAAKIQLRQQEIEGNLRGEYHSKLQEEQQRLEQERSGNAQQLERAEKDRDAAHQAQQEAAQEAQRIITEYKHAFQKQRDDEEASNRGAQERLRREAAKIQEELDQAKNIRQEAEQIKQAAEACVVETDLHSDLESNPQDPQQELKMTELQTEIMDASQNLAAAKRAEEQAHAAQLANIDELNHQQQKAQMSRLQIEMEIQEWIRSEEEFWASDEQQQILKDREQQVEWSKLRQKDAKRRAVAHNQRLMDEVANLLI